MKAFSFLLSLEISAEMQKLYNKLHD